MKAAVAPVPDRLAELEQLAINHGAHDAFSQGHCAMELVAWLANEPHSDKPKCACPVISKFIVTWNDRMRTDAERAEALRPLLPLIVGSKSTKVVERRRGWMCADWAVRDSAPAWLDWSADFASKMLAGVVEHTKSENVRVLAQEATAKVEALKVHAIALRQLGELVDEASRVLARPVIAAARQAAGEAGSASWKVRSAAYAADAADAADAASAASAAYAADAADAADAAYAAYAAYAASAAYAADAASAASAASAADAADAASAAYAADAASAKKSLEEIKAARVVSAQDLVRRLVAVSK